MRLFSELNHRNVFKVEVAYIIFGLLVKWADESLTPEQCTLTATLRKVKHLKKAPHDGGAILSFVSGFREL
jgi:hypothetical protein